LRKRSLRNFALKEAEDNINVAGPGTLLDPYTPPLVVP